MAYRVERSEESDRDLEAIFDFLVESYLSFGDAVDGAFDRAAARLAGIEDAMQSLGEIPHQGTLRPELLPGIRSVARNRTVFYFEVDDEPKRIRILAVFFGGQDHQRRMLKRIAGRDESWRR